MAEIHDLVRLKDLEGLERLLRTHPDARSLVNEQDSWGTAPLFHALDCDDPDARIVKALLDAGADVGYARVFDIPDVAGFVDGFDELLGEHGIEFPKSFSLPTGPFTEPVLPMALRTGDMAIVRLFSEHGADLRYTREAGYNAILDAVYVRRDETDVVEYLLELGVSPDVRSSFGETPVVVALRNQRFRLLARLVAFGADQAPIAWTPLIRAAAIGTLRDVQEELGKDADLNAVASTDHTALQIALMRGDEGIVDALLAVGASPAKQGDRGPSSLVCAILGGSTSLVQRMLDAGCPVDEPNEMGQSALACAAESGNHDLVRLLVERGADLSSDGCGDSILSHAKDSQTALLLIRAGAELTNLDKEAIRRLVGLPEVEPAFLAGVTKAQYMEARHQREGRANPEDLSQPYRLAMIRAGCNAYEARSRFDDPAKVACGISWNRRPPQVWCFDRFGRSFTLLPDGRTILIAGEHEDYYDPDFCIYNDVVVIHPGGEVQIFGYPYEVFEPTDSHTATLVGDSIWIVGGLGYPDQRNGRIPVYRLDTMDYSIHRVETSGDVPPRVYGHRAELVENALVIRGGQAIVTSSKGEEHRDLEEVFALDLETGRWQRRPATS
ncbi:MAG: ankyrin repeat domain-containing protein [Fimbriimonadaceae bacterium]|nr:ankyrin repeat domain-containing protein [Fimbriimonadaceae bacterium]